MTKAKQPRHPEFGQRLEEAMQKAEISAKTIQDVLAVDDETVRLWRRGQRMPRKEKMDVLAKLLGRSAAYLSHGEEGGAAAPMPGAVMVTDEDERLLLELYRQLPEWGKKSVRARCAELIENFTPAGPENPFGKVKTPGGGTQ